MISLYLPAVVTAFLIVVVEMTEVVALVFALSAEHTSVRPGATGAIAGTTMVGLAAVGFSAVLVAFPREYLLWGSALVLAGFGVFLFRSTLRTYRRRRSAPSASRAVTDRGVLFAGGFLVGAVESIEAVIVLIALAAAGYGTSALVGAILAGALLVVLAAILHERVRRIKVPALKWFATSLILTFAVFWGGEALGVPWPAGDLFLIPIFLLVLAVVRLALLAGTRAVVPFDTKS